MFTAASLARGLADTLTLLVARRVVRGFGAAGIMSVNSALVRFIVPRAQLGRGIATIVLVVATSVCSYSAQTIAFLALPFYFAVAGRMSQSRIGLLITPWPAVVVIVAPIAGRLSDQYPARLLGDLGLAVLTLGLLLILALPPVPAFVDVVLRMIVCGIGFGFFQSPNNRVMISAGPGHSAGWCPQRA